MLHRFKWASFSIAIQIISPKQKKSLSLPQNITIGKLRLFRLSIFFVPSVSLPAATVHTRVRPKFEFAI